MLNRRLWEAAVELQEFLERECIPNCVIGGLAANRWGEPRTTSDVDATLVIGFGSERETAKTILQAYASRVDDPIEFALRARIVLVVNAAGVRLDLSLGGLPFEHRILERSSLWKVEQLTPIRTCSAEDLVILKAFASRPQDWVDIEHVMLRQRKHFDRDLVLRELEPLVHLKEEPEILDRFRSVVKRFDAG
jgi:hypothetical protein